ncbi:phosphoribosylanthranilate isomerase [bacterium]|jgi:phosphoribosylanthranilate isomerase|nr:phosphoribosylanthranilate isomerase [bacterium]MBT3850693.1 phosphoribosylanthranilate isomerase [bacterium]MBT4435091.1 phosphoribosylanthranilate isomerase [bacterium]
MNKIKICGITNTNDALECVKLKVDFIGFIFYKKSKRFINLEQAQTIIKSLNTEINKVGVFVNETTQVINEYVKALGLDYVQLHGEEQPKMIEEIKCKTIKAFSVGSSSLKEVVLEYDSEYWLFDSSDDNLKGGTGKSFDWNLITDIDSKNKIILSGGLNENNIVSAIENRNINFFDICSGVESSPGHKDIQKLKSIVNLVKS